MLPELRWCVLYVKVKSRDTGMRCPSCFISVSMKLHTVLCYVCALSVLLTQPGRFIEF